MKRSIFLIALSVVLAACEQPAPPAVADDVNTAKDTAVVTTQETVGGTVDQASEEAKSHPPELDTSAGCADAPVPAADAVAVDSMPVLDGAAACKPLNVTVPGSAVFGVAVLANGGVAAVNSGSVSQGVGDGVNLYVWGPTGIALVNQAYQAVGSGRPALVQQTASGFTLAGFGKTSGAKKLWVIRTDGAGLAAQTMQYGPLDKDWSGVAASGPNGHVCFAGVETAPGKASTAMVALVNPAGELVFAKPVPSANLQAVAASAGGKWLVWSRMPVNGTDWKEGQNKLMVIGTTGAVESLVQFVGPGSPGSSAIVPDGVGGAWLAHSTQPSPEAYPYIRVDHIGGYGQSLSGWQYPAALKSGDGPRHAYGIAALDNGDIVVAGMDDPVAGYLVRLDPAAKEKWSKNFPEAKPKAGLGGLTAVAAAPGAGIVVGGGSSAGGWVARLDGCGSLNCGAGCAP